MTDEEIKTLSKALDDTHAELAKQNERLAQTKDDVEKLKEQLARMATDNEQLQTQNDKLHEEAAASRKQSQEFGDLNNLLMNKSQRLEQDLVGIGQQRDQFRDGFEKYGRKIEDLMKRLEAQKAVAPRETKIIDRG